MAKNYLCPICDSRLKGRYCPECHRIIKEPLIYNGSSIPNEHSNHCLVPKTPMRTRTQVRPNQSPKKISPQRSQQQIPYSSNHKKQEPKKKKGCISYIVIFIVIFNILGGIISTEFDEIENFNFFQDFFENSEKETIEVNPDNYGEDSDFVSYVLENYTPKEQTDYSTTYDVDPEDIKEYGISGNGYTYLDCTYDEFLKQLTEYIKDQSLGQMTLTEEISTCHVSFYDSENYYGYFLNKRTVNVGNYSISIESDIASEQIYSVGIYQIREDEQTAVDYAIAEAVLSYLVPDEAITREQLKGLVDISNESENGYLDEGKLNQIRIYVYESGYAIYWSFESIKN